MLQGAYVYTKEDYCNSYTLGVFAEDHSEMLRSCDDKRKGQFFKYFLTMKLID
jgi:hypothetical protein